MEQPSNYLARGPLGDQGVKKTSHHSIDSPCELNRLIIKEVSEMQAAGQGIKAK
jgi:hypothetical protein